jgi:hypothetical protein
MRARKVDELMNLEEILQALYDSEINAAISWLWDGGIDVRLGDWEGCSPFEP